MGEIKTKENNASVRDFIDSVKDKRDDSLKLLAIFEEITKEKPKMWGSHIIGFGKYHYKSEKSKQEGDWPLIGFSPRKLALTIYLMGGFKGHERLLNKLGKHKTSAGSCLYINKLEDVDMTILKKLIQNSYTQFKKKHQVG